VGSTTDDDDHDDEVTGERRWDAHVAPGSTVRTFGATLAKYWSAPPVLVKATGLLPSLVADRSSQ
jgi:hypothetical protein